MGSKKGTTAGSLGREKVTVALLSLIVLQGAISFTAVGELAHCGWYDPAYYYAVARNIARGDLPPVDTIWHFLGPQSLEPRWPGEYWPPGWPWLLGGLMKLFGDSMARANAIVATMSLALPPLVFWLVRSISGSTLAGWGGGLLVILQNSLHSTNVRPAVNLPYQVAVLSGLGLLVRAFNRGGAGRLPWLAAGAALALPSWLRGEGGVCVVAGLVAAMAAPSLPRRERLVRSACLAAGALAFIAPLLAYNLVFFGALTPGPRSMLPFLADYSDLYRYLGDPSLESWRGRGLVAIAESVVGKIGSTSAGFLTLNPVLLTPLALGGAVRGAAGGIRDPRTLAVALTALSGWLAQVVIVPEIAHRPKRLVEMAVPLLCVLAALGARSGLSWLSRKGGRAFASAAAVVLAVGATAWFWPADARSPLDRSWNSKMMQMPPHLDPRVVSFLDRDDLVLSDFPWFVEASLDVRTIKIPVDGPEAVREAIRVYRPLYLEVGNKHYGLVGFLTQRAGLQLRLIGEYETGAWFQVVHETTAPPGPAPGP